MKLTNEELVAKADKAFNNRGTILNLWQDIADNFYPARADFLHSRIEGDEFADHLLDGYPVQACRDLSDAIGSMLRGDNWFQIVVDGKADHAGMEWLGMATNIQRQKMNYRDSGFAKAAKEGDKDFTAFGQCVITPVWNMRYRRLLYQTWHIRDTAWIEDTNGEVCTVFRKIRRSLYQLQEAFGDSIHESHKESIRQKNGETEVDLYHIQMPIEQYGDDSKKKPYMSFYVDKANAHMLEERNVARKMYVIPRFATVSGSPYAYSPAVIAALPDARMMQAMTHTLIEAGEMSARPPYVATEGAVRGDVNIVSNGVTWVSDEYDERLGQALRPLLQDRAGLPTAFGMKEDVRMSIKDAFYLTSMTLPETQDMTAYEVNQRMREFVRKTKPLFAPVESEYNASLCELTFDILLENNQFGPVENIPQSLANREIQFKFRSPVNEAEEQGYGELYAMMIDRLKQGMEVDDTLIANVDLDAAFRETTSGAGSPQSWLRQEDQVAFVKETMAQQKAKQAAMEQLAQASQIEADSARAA